MQILLEIVLESNVQFWLQKWKTILLGDTKNTSQKVQHVENSVV